MLWGSIVRRVCNRCCVVPDASCMRRDARMREDEGQGMVENYRNSNRKKKRSQGFRSRRQTKGGRLVLNRQRALKSGHKKRKPGTHKA